MLSRFHSKAQTRYLSVGKERTHHGCIATCSAHLTFPIRPPQPIVVSLPVC